MSNYPVVRNPLLPSPPPPPSQRFRMLQQLSHPSTPSIKSSISTLSIKNVVNKSFRHLSQAGHMRSTKRIAPSSSGYVKPTATTSTLFLSLPPTDQTKKAHEILTVSTEGENEGDDRHHHRFLPKSVSTFSFMSLKKRTATKSISTSMIKKLEPIVHYNGPYHTLEQLPDEKWQWIKQPSLAESQEGLQNPLANCSTSIVFRKPHRPFSPLTSPTEPKEMRPKATFYLRVLQVTSQDSSKTRLFRCGVQINDETCMSAYTSSEKCGKTSVQANLDETFLFDIAESCNATLSVYSQQRPSVHLFYQRGQHQTQDICVGRHQFQLHLSPTQKHVQRHVITDDTSEQSYQVLVVFGVYVSHRSQTMLNNSLLLEDYLTVQVRGTFTPRLERFWAVVRGIQLELYDFDFRETRPPIYIIPLHTLIEAYHSNIEEQEEQPIGAGGLILQFSEDTLDPAYRSSILNHPEFECRMYVLAETMQRSRKWEHVLNYMVSIFDECRREGEDDDDFNSIYDEDEDEEDDLYTDNGDNDSNYRSYRRSTSFPQYRQQQQQHQGSIVPAKFLW